ncbi:MAG: leucine-rich repeat protein [Clostridia bacterium]|nr:leucine-rich repeat protein [Clostridia bacterium]
MKRTLAIFLTVMMLLSALPFAELNLAPKASAEEGTLAPTGQCGENVYWNFDESTGELIISGTGEMYDFSYEPSGAFCGDFESPFCDNETIQSVRVVGGVTYIGAYAFANCKNLFYISLYADGIAESSVERIGMAAFYRCENLYGFIIPDSVVRIDCGAFDSCSNLNSIYIPDTVKYIDDFIFCNCSNLKEVNLPSNITKIPSMMFNCCFNLESITLPSTVKTIDTSAFNCCCRLKDIYFEGTKENWEKINIIEHEGYEYNTFLYDEIYHIGIHTTDSPVFGKCGKDINWELDETTGELTISGTGEMRFYEQYREYDYSYDYNYSSPFCYHNSIKSIVIEDGIETISDYTFECCKNITSITISDSVTNIGAYAFSGCSSLASITIPDSVEYIGDYAFKDCSSLTSITIPDSITDINSWTFYKCSSLTSVTIPESVTRINYSAFYDCNSLSDVYFGGTSEQWNEIIIYNCNDPLLKATIHCTDDHVHTLSHISTPASCVIKGMEYDICVECGEVLNSVTTPEKGHSWGEWVTVTEPTVDAEGLAQRECSVCKETETQPIPKLNVAKDEKSGVEIVFSDEFDGDIDVMVSDAFDGQSLQLIEAKYPDSQTAIFDITTTQNGEKVQPDGSVTVRIPLPDGFGTENIFVCYVDSVNGNVTKIPATVENGYVVFTAEHFSHYAIIELLDSFVNYIKNVGIEINDKNACGFLPGTTVSDLKNLTSFICDVDVKTANGSDTIGTGSAITFTSITGKVIECTAIVFGDTNGDGWYDGMDSVVTNCLANGILSKEQVGEAVFAAADCNHDNIVDEKDVAILEQAGLILAKINQNKPAEELLADESYSEYISLIDQTVKAEEAPADSTADNPVDEEFNMSFIQRVFEFIMNILNLIKSFVSQF